MNRQLSKNCEACGADLPVRNPEDCGYEKCPIDCSTGEPMTQQASQDGERKSLKDFRALDAAIIAAITGGAVQFSKIRSVVWRAAAPHGNRNGELYRVIDGRLQALRRAGWIRYAGRKWSVAHD